MRSLVIGFLLLFGCARHVPTRMDTIPVESTGAAAGQYAYKVSADGRSFFVIARNDDALGIAMKAMGCGVCIQEYIGEAYQIERIGK